MTWSPRRMLALSFGSAIAIWTVIGWALSQIH